MNARRIVTRNPIKASALLVVLSALTISSAAGQNPAPPTVPAPPKPAAPKAAAPKPAAPRPKPAPAPAAADDEEVVAAADDEPADEGAAPPKPKKKMPTWAWFAIGGGAALLLCCCPVSLVGGYFAINGVPGLASASVNKDHLDRIKKDMTEVQVKAIMGEPSLPPTESSGIKAETWKNGDDFITVGFRNDKAISTAYQLSLGGGAKMTGGGQLP